MPRQYPRDCRCTFISSPLPLWPSYVESLADNGFTRQLPLDEGLRQGVTHYQGHITSQPVATGLERDFTPIDELV